MNRFYTREGHATKTLGAVHETLKAQYKMNKQEEQESQLLEKFLHAYKVFELSHRQVYMSKTNIDKTILLKELDEVISSGIINDSIMNTLGTKANLFEREQRGKANKFEQAFAIIQAGCYSYFDKDAKKDMKDFLAGSDLAGMIGGDEKTGTYKLENLPNVLNQKLLKKYFVGATEQKIPKGKTISFTIKDQKIDNRGLNLTLSYNLTDESEKAMYLMATKNFSLKNYISYKGDITNEITIGSTTPFRAIGSVLLTLVDDNEMKEIFFQGILSKSKEAQYHLYHLQAIYEFSGRGQVRIGGELLPEVDFLVINDPTTTNIQVISINNMIAKILDENTAFSKHVSVLREVHDDIYHRYQNTQARKPKKKK